MNKIAYYFTHFILTIDFVDALLTVPPTYVCFELGSKETKEDIYFDNSYLVFHVSISYLREKNANPFI